VKAEKKSKWEDGGRGVNTYQTMQGVMDREYCGDEDDDDDEEKGMAALSLEDLDGE
jgi:hypothetical protein